MIVVVVRHLLVGTVFRETCLLTPLFFSSFCSFRTEATEVVVMEEDTEEGMEDTVAGELFNDKHFGSSLKGIIVVILFTNHNTNVS